MAEIEPTNNPSNIANIGARKLAHLILNANTNDTASPPKTPIYGLALGAVADFGALNCQYTTKFDAR